MMKTLVVLVLVGIALQDVAAVTHSLKYFYTASSGIKTFPEFVTVGMVNDQQISYYDNIIKKEIPKQDWMEKMDPDYWEGNTQKSIGAEQNFKADINIAMQRFNQTGGVHIVQFMYGCEWDDETGEVTGYQQHGYDGEDFLILNAEINTWIAPKQQAKITTNKWNNNKAQQDYIKNYQNQICPEWLKKYVGYGRSSLMRTDLPSVSFLQKTSSSPVSCHATGFYPNRAEMFWRKDGEEVHDGVDKGEILPNNDGTFQMSVDIDLSSVAAEDWTKYECVFQLSGVKEDVTHRLKKTRIRTGNDSSGFPTGGLIGGIVFVGLLALVTIIAGVVLLTRKPNGFKQTNTSDTSSSSSSEDPKKAGGEQQKMIA